MQGRRAAETERIAAMETRLRELSASEALDAVAAEVRRRIG